MQTVVVVTTSNGAESTQKSLVTRVRDAIKDAGINHSEVARQIGLDASKLSKSLAGTRKFRVEEISHIAELTGVTTDWLTTGRTARPPRRTMVVDVHAALNESPADGFADDARMELVGGGAALGPASEREWMSKGTRNRVTIIAAAWELYADLGIDKVRTEDVARAAGMTASAVNYHFRTKDQLLQAALRLLPRYHRRDPPPQRLRRPDRRAPPLRAHPCRSRSEDPDECGRSGSNAGPEPPPTKEPGRTSPPSTANGWT